MLMNFYTGDKEQIVDALVHREIQRSAGDSYVIANADFSFHLSPDELDEIVLSACQLLSHPPITLSDSIQADFFLDPPSDPEAGIHEMSTTFIDLFASLPLGDAEKLYELWCTKLPEQPVTSPDMMFQRLVRKLKQGIGFAIVAIVITPLIAANWLFSSRFRKDRKLNKMKQARSGADLVAGPEYTLLNAIEALIETCQAAKTHHTKVIYAWSL
jgi:hypothetical protein